MQSTLRFAPVPRVAWLLVVIVLLAALAAAAVAIGSRYRQPAPPFGLARNGAILYVGADNDIYRLDPLTGASTAVVAGPSLDRHPWLSPDGTKFLFVRDVTDPVSGSSGQAVMVANDDGSEIRSLTGTLAGITMARWSNDGSKVAVASSGPAPVLQVFSVAGSAEPVAIPIQATATNYVAFRPGDRELTFRASVPGGDGLYVVGVDGRGLRTIVPPGQGDGASLSPDGTKLAYMTSGGGYGTTHVVDVDTGRDETPVFEPDAKTTGLVDDAPQWSPDGTRFIFTRYRIGKDNHLAAVAATGGRVVEIGPAMANETGGGRAEFSPDGSKVLAHFNSDGSTWLLDPTGATAGTRLEASVAETANWQRLAP